MKTYRVGLIGMGFIGKVHAYGHINLPLFIENLPFRSEIVRVCTSNPASASREAAKISADPCTNYREITEADDIDVVHICCPNHLHLEPLLSAMRCGKAIYCEKPLVKNCTEAEAIEDALRDYRGIHRIVFQTRFFPAVMRAKQLMDSGKLGKLLQFRASFLHSGSLDPELPLTWKSAEETGGGVIADLGAHVFDLMEYLCGKINEVQAVTQIAFPFRPLAGCPEKRVPVTAEDAFFSLCKLANGAVGTIDGSKIAAGSEDELSFEIYGTQGGLRFCLMAPHYLEYTDRDAPRSPYGGLSGWTKIACGQRYEAPAGKFPSPKSEIGWLRGHLQSLYDFMNAVHTHTLSSPNFFDGIANQWLLEAVRRSAKTGNWQTVARSTALDRKRS